MVKVKALRNGQTRLVGQIRTMAGECIGFTEVLSADACRIAFGAYADSADIVIPSFDDIFGKLGYSGSDQWRVYYHFAHHIARM